MVGHDPGGRSEDADDLPGQPHGVAENFTCSPQGRHRRADPAPRHEIVQEVAPALKDHLGDLSRQDGAPTQGTGDSVRLRGFRYGQDIHRSVQEAYPVLEIVQAPCLRHEFVKGKAQMLRHHSRPTTLVDGGELRIHRGGGPHGLTPSWSPDSEGRQGGRVQSATQ